MVTLKTISTGLAIAFLSALPIAPTAIAQPCPSVSSGNISYGWRGDRCEGTPRGSNSSSRNALVGFSTTRLSNTFPAQLTIRVPALHPSGNVRLQQRGNYLVDNFDRNRAFGRNGFRYTLGTDLLRRLRGIVTPRNIEAIARHNGVHYPVVLGNASGSYTFTVLLTSNDTLRGEIYYNGRKIGETSHGNRRTNLHRLQWSYRNRSNGTYTVKFIRGNGRAFNAKFAHNRTWY